MFYRDAFFKAVDACIILDSNAQIIDANAAALHLLSCESSSLVGKNITDIFSSERETKEFLRDGFSLSLIRKGSESFAVNASIQTLSSSDATSVAYSVVIQPTPPQQLEQSKEGHAGRQQKLESLGVLASGIAHDLNNVLTGVLGHVSYLRLSMPDEVSHRDSVFAIEDGARRAASMTQQILEFARGEEMELGTVNLSMVLGAGINLLRASLPQNIELDMNTGIQDLYVCGDESQLSQLVLNLLVNAQDALPKGGKISIGLEVINFKSEMRLGSFSVPAGNYAKLSLSDNGEGIPPEVLDRIFEPFFTTKSNFGTGIGLANVHSIVSAHLGAIVVESTPNQGCCFEVYLPEGIQEEVTTKKEENELPRGSERILVVDDEEAVRTVIHRSLELLGYTVEVARNGLEAIEIFENPEKSFDLVILDMIMPQLAGDEVFYKLKNHNEHVSVLIASGYSSDSRTRAVLEDGALGFIQKPFAVEELAQEVRRCIDLRKSLRD